MHWWNSHKARSPCIYLKMVKHFQIQFLRSEYQNTEGSCLMRISLVRMLLLWFFKTFRKYLPYANFGLFISLVQFFGQKNAKKTSHKWNKWPKLRITNQINTIWIGRSLGAMFMCRESSKNFFTFNFKHAQCAS